jgi:hypothetical protein
MSTPARAVPGRTEAGVTDPEQKRKIIGARVRRGLPGRGQEAAERQVAGAGHDLPDVIESGGAKTKKAHTIKSHHNVGGLPETLHLKLLEPLRELFKDEVRELGVARPAARHGVPPSLPGAGARRAHPRRGEARIRRPAAPRRRDLHRRAARRRLVRQDQRRPSRSSCRCARGRDGRRPHLRVRGGACARCRRRTS